MSDTPLFRTLIAEHASLHELFLAHQEAIVNLNVSRALELLVDYRTRLVEHMRLEEELLLPLFTARVEKIRGAAPELFSGEHARMREALERFERALGGLSGGALDLRGAIALIDHQYMFKHLCEHHHHREEELFFPHLERVTSEAERAELLERAGLPCV